MTEPIAQIKCLQHKFEKNPLVRHFTFFSGMKVLKSKANYRTFRQLRDE